MNTIKLTQPQLEHLTYEIASSLSEIEETSEDFNVLFVRAIELAYPVYKKKYDEEPDIDFDPEFSSVVSDSLLELLNAKYDTFLIKEDEDKDGFVKTASFYALKDGIIHTLIKDLSDIVYI